MNADLYCDKHRPTKTVPKHTELTRALLKLSEEHRAALYRVAKTRARAFFADPNSMMELRSVVGKKN